jgi:hypothetical protein
MKPINEMSSAEYKEYEKIIFKGEVANESEIDFVLESDNNFVICKDGTKKINPKSEFRKYLKLLFKQKEKERLKESFDLIK